MKERTRRIFIMIVMAALIVSLMAASFAALTYGRYSGGRFDENSPYEDYIDFVGATAYEVSSPEELVNAINNGYSYIKIAADAEEPFVVNSDIADVEVNLVLDVNGHVVVRNSRNPLINVQKSVSVVLVYDSSTTAKGGFYNPVGSALQTSGGTLTVGAGVYESGPNEKYQTKNYSTGQQVTLFDREARTGSYLETGTSATDLPILTDRNAGTQEDPVSVYDYYFESAPSGLNALIEDDTYLIYTTESNCVEQDGQLFVNCTKTGTGTDTNISGTRFSVESNVASCDFYYYYPVGAAGTADAFQEYAVVYGYHDVKALAEDCTDTSTDLRQKGLVWPYAAIRSEAGNTFARGGVFKTHFGTQNTYGIYSKGGEMTVGTDSANSAPSFTATGEGVCIRMSEGENNTLTISSGSFSSEIGNTIQMEGGAMTVTRGSFTKNASSADKNSTDNGSAIDIQGGTINSSESESTEEAKPIQFKISGSYVNGIHAADGEVNIANASFGFSDGNNNQGIFNNGGTSRAHWCDFTIPGNNNYGIHSEGGTTRASDCNITMTGDYVVGVYTTGGRALIEGGSIKVNFAEDKEDKNNKLLTSTAVSTEGGEIYLAGSLKIESDSLGVTVRKVEETEGSLEIADQEVKIENTTYKVAKGNVTIYTPNATGIYVNNGTFTNKGTVSVTSFVGNEEGADKGWNWVDAQGGANTNFNKYNGIYVQGGSLISNGTLNVTFTGVENEESGTYLDQQIKSYAVRVETAASGGKTEVSIAGGTISNSVGGGVYVGGGTVTLGVENDNTGPTVRTTGTVSYSTSMDPDGGNWNYFLPKTGGPAVKVAQSGSVSSTLTVYGGTYTAQQGDGIVTVGGTSYIHNGTFIGRDYNAVSGERAGPGASYSFKVYGGTANVYGGTFGGQENDNYINSSGAFVMGTSANSMGTANIYGGTFVVSEVLSDNADNGGQAGFSVYEYGNVLVAPKGGENGTGTDVTMTGLAAGLVIEGNTSNTVSVEIKGGEFSSTRNHGYSDGIWYSNSNATLTISGGTFTGYARSGLYFEATPNTIDSDNTIMIVQISGGCFKGKPERDGGSSNYKSGAIAGVVGWDKPGYEIGVNYILKIGAGITSSGWGDDETVKDEDGSSKWNDAIQETLASCSWIEIS